MKVVPLWSRNRLKSDIQVEQQGGLMNIVSRVVALLVVFRFVLGAPSPADAQASSTVSMSIRPSSVALAVDEEAKVRIVVTNSSTKQPISNLKLNWIENAGIKIVVDKRQLAELPSQSSHAWEARITRLDTGSPTGQVLFYVDFDSDKIHGTADGSLDIQARIAETIDKIAQAQVLTSLDVVKERHERPIYLVVTNISALPVTITGIRINGSSLSSPLSLDQKLTPMEKGQKADKDPNMSTSLTLVDSQEVLAKLKEGIRLDPQQSYALVFFIAAEGAVQPGERLLLFEVSLEWYKSQVPSKGTLIAQYKYKVGVLGESEILTPAMTALAIPTFFLLPGFLMLMGYYFFNNKLWPKTPLTFDIKDPGSIAGAMTLSLVTILLYPHITGIFVKNGYFSRNLLEGYGPRDIFAVWFGSIMSGSLAWLFHFSENRIKLKFKQRWYVPSVNDSEVDALSKLAHRGMGFQLQSGIYQGGSDSQDVFLITEIIEGQDKVWVAPYILFKWGEKAKDTLIRKNFDSLFQRGTRPEDSEELAKIIKLGKQSGMFETIKWDESGLLKGCKQISTADFKLSSTAPLRIIREMREN